MVTIKYIEGNTGHLYQNRLLSMSVLIWTIQNDSMTDQTWVSISVKLCENPETYNPKIHLSHLYAYRCFNQNIANTPVCFSQLLNFHLRNCPLYFCARLSCDLFWQTFTNRCFFWTTDVIILQYSQFYWSRAGQFVMSS